MQYIASNRFSGSAFVVAIFVGQPQSIHDSQGTWASSIYRKAVNGPVSVFDDGLEGDRVTQPYHGGAGAAVCAHVIDHYRFWNERFNMSLEPGNVGENITLDGIAEDQVYVGDIVKVGTSLLQVSGPRVPCANQARRIGRLDWVKLTIQQNRTGFYLRVLKGGAIRPGDEWNLEERLNVDASIPSINRCMYLQFEAECARRIARMTGLDPWWQEQICEKLANNKEHWTNSMSK